MSQPIPDLLATVPDVGKYAKVEVNNISNVPSGYMDPVRWVALSREVERSRAREPARPQRARRKRVGHAALGHE